MARGQHQSISEKLNTVETFIIMGQKKEITDVMDGYSYPKAKLQAMEPVLAQAKKLVSVQVTESAERIASTEAAEHAHVEFAPRYTKHLGLLRVIYEENTVVRMGLKLDERRKEGDLAFCDQAEQLYITLFNNPSWITPLEEFSISEDLLREDLQLLQGLKAAVKMQNVETEEAIQATVTRDEALEKLYDWADRYKKVAKLALKGNANLLGILGL